MVEVDKGVLTRRMLTRRKLTRRRRRGGYGFHYGRDEEVDKEEVDKEEKEPRSKKGTSTLTKGNRMKEQKSKLGGDYSTNSILLLLCKAW